MSITALFKQAAQRAQEEEKRRREAEKAALQRLLNQKKEQAQAKVSAQRAIKQINQRISTPKPQETTETVKTSPTRQRFTAQAQQNVDTKTNRVSDFIKTANQEQKDLDQRRKELFAKFMTPKQPTIRQEYGDYKRDLMSQNKEIQQQQLDAYLFWNKEAEAKGLRGQEKENYVNWAYNLDPAVPKTHNIDSLEQYRSKRVEEILSGRMDDADYQQKVELGNQKNCFVTGKETEEETIAYAEGWDKSFITEYRPFINQEDVEKLSYLKGDAELSGVNRSVEIRDLQNKIVQEAQQAYEDDRFARGDYVKSNYYVATPIQGAVSAWQGLGSAMRRVKGDKTPAIITAEQQAYQQELAQAGGVKKVFGDVAFNVGRMVASGGTAGFAASIAGNTYSEARREGRGETESMVYGVLTAGSEVGLMKLLGIPLGGIRKFVGTDSLLKKAIARASSNTTVQKAVGILGDMTAEGTEEYLQEVLDPILRNVAFGERNPVTLLPEGGFYSFVIGALTTGVMNSVSYGGEYISQRGSGSNDGGATTVTYPKQELDNIRAGTATAEDVAAIVDFGKRATPEMVEQFAQEVDTVLEVDMGGKTLREIKQEANALPDEASKTDLYYRQINSPEFQEAARRYMQESAQVRADLSEEITAPIQDIETDTKVAENSLQAGTIPFNEAMQQLETKVKVNNETMTDWLTKQINQRSKKRNTEQETYTKLRTREFADFLESARAYAEQQGMKQKEAIAYLKRESQRYADETMLGIKERSMAWERTKEQRELNNALRKHLTQSENAQIEKGMDLYYRAFNRFNDMDVAQWSKLAKDLKTKHEKNLKKGRYTNLEKTARELQDSQRVEKLREEIDLEIPQVKLTPLELKSVLARILVTDTGASIMDFDHDIYGKKDTQKHLYKEFDYMRRGRSAAETAVYTGQVNLEGRTVGESLNSIFKDIENKPYKHLVPDYMYHRHNVDRAGNSKGLFGKQFSPEESTQIYKQMEAQYPELDGIAERFYKFFGNNLDMVAESGLITQDLSDLLEAMYQSYIPVERDLTQEIELPAGTVIDLNNPQYEQRKNVSQVIKRATESDLPLINFREAMIRQTKRVYTQSYRNVFANKLLDAVLANKDNSKIGKYVYGVKVLAEGEAATNVPSIVFYRNGQRVQMFLSQPMHDAFTNLVDQSNRFRPITNAFETFSNTFKKLVTSYNPTFFVSNFTKDMGDAMIYSKNPPHIFLKNVSQAPYDMATNTQMWQDYVNSGSFGSSMFDYLQTSGLKKFGRGAIGVMEKGNFYIEQVPRFAEYKSTMEALQPKIDGGDISWRDAHVQAMYNSADVTVNFARSGKATKFLNRTFVPFLNPSVQGVSKMVRNVTEIGGPKAAFPVILKGAIFGFGAAALNYLIYDDDDDFKQLSDYKKRNFYLIKKKDGTFIAIPKGRVSSVIGETLRHVGLQAKGEPVDWAEFANWAWNQVGVESPVTSHILSPFAFAKQNKTWYGGDIESKYDQSKPEAERYDETTDAISKFIGGKLNISPKKINYILTSYGGVITDLLLPPITPATSGGNAWEYIASPWKRRFSADSVMNSGISGKFYTELDKAERLKNAQNAPEGAEYQYKYLDQQRWAVQDVYKEINAIENDSSLSLKEKGDRIKALRGILNVHFAQTLEDFEKVKEASKYYTVTGDEQKDKKHYADMIYEVFGAEKALQSYSKGVYEDATDYAQFGISFDDYYDFYFLTKDIDAKDADGISVTNLKKERIYNVIESMDIPKEHKMLLFMKTYGSHFSEEERAGLLQQLDSLSMTKEDKFLLGVKMNIIRTPRTKQGKLDMLNYIETLNMTKEEKYALANKLKLITRSL